jgi:hypothetical protein
MPPPQPTHIPNLYNYFSHCMLQLLLNLHSHTHLPTLRRRNFWGEGRKSAYGPQYHTFPTTYDALIVLYCCCVVFAYCTFFISILVRFIFGIWMGFRLRNVMERFLCPWRRLRAVLEFLMWFFDLPMWTCDTVSYSGFLLFARARFGTLLIYFKFVTRGMSCWIMMHYMYG